MNTYTPTPGRMTVLSLPQDAIDLRRVITVNTAFQTLGDAVVQAQSELDVADDKINALPGVGLNYGSYTSVPATCAISPDGVFVASTADNLRTGIVLQSEGSYASPDAIIGLQCIPLTGVITGFNAMLIGRGPGAGHTQMPENPFKAELYRVASTGATLLATCEEDPGQTYSAYDVIHKTASSAISHTIAHKDASFPAHYQIAIYGENGTGSITGGAYYSFTIYFQGVDV